MVNWLSVKSHIVDCSHHGSFDGQFYIDSQPNDSITHTYIESSLYLNDEYPDWEFMLIAFEISLCPHKEF